MLIPLTGCYLVVIAVVTGLRSQAGGTRTQPLVPGDPVAYRWAVVLDITHWTTLMHTMRGVQLDRACLHRVTLG